MCYHMYFRTPCICGADSVAKPSAEHVTSAGERGRVRGGAGEYRALYGVHATTQYTGDTLHTRSHGCESGTINSWVFDRNFYLWRRANHLLVLCVNFYWKKCNPCHSVFGIYVVEFRLMLSVIEHFVYSLIVAYLCHMTSYIYPSAFVIKVMAWTHRSKIQWNLIKNANFFYQEIKESALNLSWSSDAIWWHISGSALAQVMACCQMAPSHYLNQCWLIIRKFQ